MNMIKIYPENSLGAVRKIKEVTVSLSPVGITWDILLRRKDPWRLFSLEDTHRIYCTERRIFG